MSEELVRFLKSASIPTEGNNLLTTLENLGVENLDDLEFLEGGDLEDSGLTIIQRRKLLQKAKQLFVKGNGHSAIPQTEAGSMQSVPPVSGARFGPVDAPSYSVPLEQIPTVQPGLSANAMGSARGPLMSHEAIPGVQLARSPSKCQIGYIFCSSDLFTVNSMKRSLYIDLEKDSMEFLADLILTNEGLSQDSISIELFTHEGYPIVLNDYNKKVPLRMWELSNDALFYAFSRPKLQPFWATDEEEFTFVDPCHGKNEVLIYSAIHCGLPINVDLPCPVDVIVNKVTTRTNISSQNISLHKTLRDIQRLTDEDVLFLQDGDTIIMRLNPKFKRGNDYGKKTYTPMIQQTDHGISKFYSILKYLVHQRTVCPLIVQFLRQHTSFPPLAYAFHLFQREHYIINLSHAVALFEGFYCLFSSLLSNFCIIPKDEVMEYSDYVFGLILKLTKDQKQTEISEHSLEYLTCPITDRRILRPVALPSSDRVYEKLAVEMKIKDNGDVRFCKAEGLQLGDMMPSQRHQRLLILSDYDQASSFCIWKISPSPQVCIPAVAVPCNWEELATCHKELNVCDPDALAGKNNVLTYLDDGRMVFFTTPLMSGDLSKEIYDPLTGDVESHTVSKMASFKSSGNKKVFRDIRLCLNPKIKGSTSTESIADPSLAVKKKQEVGEITREPEEAIMVMLDTSGSMDESIFKEEGGITKLSAAKDYFNSFSNRIEAYGLPQVIGLISFSNTSKLEIPFTEVMDQFKNVLGRLSSGGGTALYKATLVAVEKLKEFTKKYPLCKRRILCLTDGHDNSSTKPHEVVTVLQREKVVVDTVLVTDKRGNVSQKALSHATGGYCFLPDSSSIAYRLFEMETLLTLEDRDSSQPVSAVASQDDFDKFRNLRNFPYNSTDPYGYKSQFAMGLDDHSYCSAQSMVQRAQIIGFVTAASSSSSNHHVRRLLQEIKHYQNNPHPKIEIFPEQSNVCLWKVLLQAPEGTPYEGGTYLLCAKFPESYPSEPPEFRFITPIYHCNINSSGRICHPVLGRNYLPSMSMREIFDHVFGLLMAPEPLHPLDSMLASEYHHSRITYEQNARKHARKYAMKVSLDDLKKELTKDEDTGVDESLVCPLTHKVFVDPVATQYGYTYERAALMKYMAENNNMDPQAKKPIARERIISVEAVKKMADFYRKTKVQT